MAWSWWPSFDKGTVLTHLEHRLFVGARLVHGDLSEYNILVAPSFQVENAISSVEDKEMDLQVVLIDFGQAVEIRHPEAQSFLERDLARVRTFFDKQGTKTLTMQESLEFVTSELEDEAKEPTELHTTVVNPLEAQS